MGTCFYRSKFSANPSFFIFTWLLVARSTALSHLSTTEHLKLQYYLLFVMANVDTHEEFWGILLDKEKRVFMWDPAADSEEDVEHKIQLTQACLGHKAKAGERNLIEVTTENDELKKVTVPIVSLSVGGKECIHLELGFNNATKFVLKEGSGPVGLSGVHLQALPLDLEDNDASSEESKVEEVKVVEEKKAETEKKVEAPVAEETVEKKKI